MPFVTRTRSPILKKRCGMQRAPRDNTRRTPSISSSGIGCGPLWLPMSLTTPGTLKTRTLSLWFRGIRTNKYPGNKGVSMVFLRSLQIRASLTTGKKCETPWHFSSDAAAFSCLERVETAYQEASSRESAVRMNSVPLRFGFFRRCRTWLRPFSPIGAFDSDAEPQYAATLLVRRRFVGARSMQGVVRPAW